MMGKKEQRAEVLDLYDKGLNRTQISRATGILETDLTDILREEGLVLDVTKVKARNKGRLEEAAEQRARIMRKMMNASESLLGQMDAPARVFNFGGRDNTFAEVELDAPPIADKLRLMQAAGIGVDKALALAAHDAGSARVSINLIMATAEKLGLDTSDGE
jgi:hypothetical protein